ncbi:MAG TPA: hypothetical protein VFY42_08860 [Gemmatimonadales bacterium]|nr:hypothetical protein [Gemmatimonadales bacterium]
MISDTSMSWAALLALGAGHGINPAMGWLFAVALGLQRESRGAVWRALTPLALGHALAIAAAIAAAGVVGLIVPLEVLKWSTAGLLVGLGVFRLVRSRHIRFGGMQVNARELATWSFLMASAHGAGLMVLPLVLGNLPATGHTHHVAAASVMGIASVEWSSVLAALVHTAGYLLATGAIAVIVYERVGLRFLRRAWVNLDLIWAVALVVTGVATVVL